MFTFGISLVFFHCCVVAYGLYMHLFIIFMVDGFLNCVQFGDIVNKLAANLLYMSFGGHVSIGHFLLLLDIYSDVELLSHRVVVSLGLVNTATEFLKVVLLVTLPPEGIGVPAALHPPHLTLPASLILAN